MVDAPPAHERYLIGALLQVPVEVIRRRVAAAVMAAGFPNYRPAHAAVFMWLSAQGDRISDLAARVGVSKQAMGETLQYLERHGYVERVPHPSDGRATLVRRTDRGWAVNQTARRVVEEVQAEWEDLLGEVEFAELLRLLRRLIGRLGEPPAVAADPRMLPQAPRRPATRGQLVRSRRRPSITNKEDTP